MLCRLLDSEDSLSSSETSAPIYHSGSLFIPGDFYHFWQRCEKLKYCVLFISSSVKIGPLSHGIKWGGGEGLDNQNNALKSISFSGFSVYRSICIGEIDKASWRPNVQDNEIWGILQCSDRSGWDFADNCRVVSRGRNGVGWKEPDVFLRY